MKAIILAGQRSSASARGRRRPPPTPLTLVAGTPSLVRVLGAVRKTSGIDGGVLVGPARCNGDHQAAVSAILAPGDFTWLPPAEGPAESALRAIDHLLATACEAPTSTVPATEARVRPSAAHGVTSSVDYPPSGSMEVDNPAHRDGNVQRTGACSMRIANPARRGGDVQGTGVYSMRAANPAHRDEDTQGTGICSMKAGVRPSTTQGSPWPVLLTTGDHALLTAPTLEAFCSAAAQTDADLVVGLVPHPLVQIRFPQMRRTRLRFRDGVYCGANLFYLRHTPAMAAIGLWRKLQSLRKQPWRMAGQLGWRTLAAYALGALSLNEALAKLSDLSECAIGWTEVEDPLAAVDVDSWADHQVAEQIL